MSKPLGKRIKNNILYAGALLAYTLASLLPRSLGLKLFGGIGKLVFLVPGTEKNRTLSHLRKIFGTEWTEKKIKKTAGQVYCGLGKNLFDMIHIPTLSKDQFDKIVTHEDLQSFSDAYNRKKGVIVITAHAGCFEMLLHFFAIHGFSSFAIGRKMFDPRLEQLIRRTRSGNNIAYLDRSENTIKIVRLLREGRAFGVLIDQDTRVEGVFANFLGYPAYTPSGPIKLAMKMGIPAFVVTTVRCEDNTHHVFISEQLQLLDTGNFESDLVANVEMANELICSTIKKYPEQWVWMHRRWRRKPSGKGNRISMRVSLYVIVALAAGLVSFFFSGCAPKKESLPFSEESIATNFQDFEHATLYFYNNDYVQWRLESEKMRKPISDTGSILVIPVRLTLFDSLGTLRTIVLSDSGTTGKDMESFIVWGDVYIRTRDSLVIRTQKLWWHKNKRKVESNTFVQIETKRGDILRGKGLDATEDFSRFSFKSNVSGKFPDFKRRVETNEESVF